MGLSVALITGVAARQRWNQRIFPAGVFRFGLSHGDCQNRDILPPCQAADSFDDLFVTASP